jgi:hypothetical protein
MALIKVKTPAAASPITLVWDDGKVHAKGDKLAKVLWQDMQNEGLFGRYGHAINLDNVSMVDLYTALTNQVPRANVSPDSTARALLKQGLKDKAPSDELT